MAPVSSAALQRKLAAVCDLLTHAFPTAALTDVHSIGIGVQLRSRYSQGSCPFVVHCLIRHYSLPQFPRRYAPPLTEGLSWALGRRGAGLLEFSVNLFLFH